MDEPSDFANGRDTMNGCKDEQRQPSTPQEWVARCFARLRMRVPDMDVREEDLAACAADLLEDVAYNKLPAETAAEQ